MGTELKLGKEGLIHVALVGTSGNCATACGAEVWTPLGTYDQATCVACTSGIVICQCGATSELRYCDYDCELYNRSTPCACCLACAKKCYENV